MLDVSGSMRTRDIDGGTRMAAAKQAFNEVLDATPEEVRLGIRTLGADYPGDDRKTGCRTPRSSTRSARWTAPRPRRRWRRWPHRLDADRPRAAPGGRRPRRRRRFQAHRADQ
ncbi:VWA domain-containing protein [Streptomyces thinghirensis]|nr:VWA domain-containing protein [Streptomyces thinghirensis]